MTSQVKESIVANAAPAATIDEHWLRTHYPLLVDGVIKHLMEEQQQTDQPSTNLAIAEAKS